MFLVCCFYGWGGVLPPPDEPHRGCERRRSGVLVRASSLFVPRARPHAHSCTELVEHSVVCRFRFCRSLLLSS